MNKEIKVRVLGKLISKDKLEQYTGNINKMPVYIREDPYVQNKFRVSIVLEPLSDLPEEFENAKYFNCNTEYLDSKYSEMSVEEIEEDLKFKYITFVPKKYDNNEYIRNGIASNSGVAYDPEIIDTANGNNDSKFIPLPYFDLDELNISIEEFENSILNGKVINVIPAISYDVCQGMCVVKKNKEGLYLQGNDIFIYTNIKKIDCTDSGVIINLDSEKINKFIIDPEEYVDKNILFDNWQDKRLKQKSNVIFVNVEKVSEWDKLLSYKLNIEAKKENLEEGIDNEYRNDIIELETEFINVLCENANNLGLLYDKKDLINFHIAVKSSGLVILSGMSGTGKSKLINLYAKTLGLNDRFKMIPVSPAWTDDTDLLGYLDYKNMIYRPADTDLVNFLIEAQNNQDNIYIVCFDEMNLARVEHYFSQFISVLENNENEKYIQLYNSKLRERVYNSNIYPPQILIGKNVIFVGTVNIDESTFHFSDKVLDRASVIKLNMCSFVEFGKLKNRKSFDEIKTVNFTTKKFFNSDIDISFVLTNEELEFLNQLNILLKTNNPRMGIGYRIIVQINQYIAAIFQHSDYSRDDAFDNLIVQRILTKIRGADDQIVKLIGIINEEGILEKSELNNLFDKYANLSKFEQSKKILEQKAKELKLYGYTI